MMIQPPFAEKNGVLQRCQENPGLIEGQGLKEAQALVTGTETRLPVATVVPLIVMV
jgi:hypothetical protein